MTEARLALLVVIALSALTALADVLVKKAAEINRIDSIYLVLAAGIFGASAYGWYFTLKHINLATLGGVYSLVTVLLLVLAGTVFFGEKLKFPDILVLAMSVIALIVFWRHL